MTKNLVINLTSQQQQQQQVKHLEQLQIEKSVISSELPLVKTLIRLDYVDGLRGLTALYVAIYHALGLVNFESPESNIILSILQKIFHLALITLFRYGHFGVVVFIVISGYSLMI